MATIYKDCITIVLCVFFTLVLATPSGFSDGYSDLPEHYIVGSNPQHINSSHGILYSKLLGSFTPNKSKQVSSHRGRNTSYNLLCTILLLSGDIHPCPGPNYKYPCGTCHKPVRKNQKGILCDLCNIWYHAKCINMPDREYFRLGNCDEPWECNNCLLPFDFTDSFFNSTVHDTSGVSSHNTSNESVHEETLFMDFSNLRRKHPRNFIVTHININSVQHKFDELSIILRNRLVDCLFISESKLNDSHLPGSFQIQDYTMYRKDNTLDGGGGLLAYIRSDIPSYCVKPDTGRMETLLVNCIIKGQKWSFAGVYRKPSIAQSIINEQLETVIDQNLNLCDNFIILGDLNCNMLKDSDNSVKKMCNDFNLTNIIKSPTCFKGDPPSLIDVMLVSNAKSYKTATVTPCPLSDFHHFITGVLKVDLPRTTSRKVTYRSFKHFDHVAFGNDLRQAPFQVGEVLDIDDHMAFFQDLFLTVLNKHAPLKTKVIRTRQVPHMTKEWKSAIYRRNMAYNTFMSNKSDNNWEAYRQLRNQCVKLSKLALKNYFTEKCTSNSGPTRDFWQTVKPYFSKKSKQTETIQLQVDGKIISDPTEVAEVFNNHYLNIASQIGKK